MAGKLIKQVWQRYPALYVIFLSCGPLAGFVDAGEHAGPIWIGALTDSWGPTPLGGGPGGEPGGDSTRGSNGA